MPRQSAGILLYRLMNEQPQVFLVHPGGPFWGKKDLGVWSIPKGEIEENEEPLKVAIREFKEETGQEVAGNFIPLKPVKQKSGKMVFAWACEGEADAKNIFSNEFEMEWPPKSGQMKSFPEVDRAEWFNLQEAREKINPGQVGLIEEVELLIS